MTDLNELMWKSKFPYSVDLQYFADGGDGGSGDDLGGGDGGDGGESTPSLDELLENPEFKKQYQERVQGSINQRLKKYENVDVEKYKQWEKEQEEKENADLTESEKLKKKLDAYEKQELAIESRERDVEIKTAAIEAGYDPKLIGRLIDASSITKNDNGEFEGITDAIEAVKEEFPQLFPDEADDEGDDGTGDTASSKVKTPNPPRQKGNPHTPKNKREAGRMRALERHKKD